MESSWNFVQKHNRVCLAKNIRIGRNSLTQPLVPKRFTSEDGIGIGIFNDNIDENQTTTNHHGLQDQGMRP